MAFGRVSTEVKNILLWHRHFAIIEGKGSDSRQKPKRPDHQHIIHIIHSRVEAERSPGARVVRRCWLGGRGGQARNMGSHWVLRGVSTTPHTHFLLPSNQHFQCKTTRKGIGQKMGSLRGPSNQCCVIVTDRSVSLLSPELERLGRLRLGSWWVAWGVVGTPCPLPPRAINVFHAISDHRALYTSSPAGHHPINCCQRPPGLIPCRAKTPINIDAMLAIPNLWCHPS